MNWIHEHRELLETFVLVSAGMFCASLLGIPVVVARLPADYFVGPKAPPMGWQIEHPVGRFAWIALRNAFGGLLVLAGLTMLVLPGQGLISILLGFGLMTFPGKRRLELSVVRRPPVLAALNWIRRRAGREPLRV